jgi:hypothetical protein
MSFERPGNISFLHVSSLIKNCSLNSCFYEKLFKNLIDPFFGISFSSHNPTNYLGSDQIKDNYAGSWVVLTEISTNLSFQF